MPIIYYTVSLQTGNMTTNLQSRATYRWIKGAAPVTSSQVSTTTVPATTTVRPASSVPPTHPVKSATEALNDEWESNINKNLLFYNGNKYWVVQPKTVLPAGTYTIIDSDPATWSCNAQSGMNGHSLVKGLFMGER